VFKVNVSPRWIWLLMTCMAGFKPKRRTGPFLNFLGSPTIFIAKSVFLSVNASLRWLNNGSCIFLSFLLIRSGVPYNCVLIKVDWLAACIALRIVGVVFKKWPCPPVRPRTNHPCHQKPNPSREIIPLRDEMRGIKLCDARVPEGGATVAASATAVSRPTDPAASPGS
jgi:hypothetical protein